MRTLDDVQRALRVRVGSDDAMKLVTTRVFLRTGVKPTASRQAPPRTEPAGRASAAARERRPTG